MDDIGDAGNQVQGKELYKQQFKQDFTPRLNEILGFGDAGNQVQPEALLPVLEGLIDTAIVYGRSYIEEAELEYSDCSEHLGNNLPQIGQQRCFMQLLRECDRNSPVGRELQNIEAQAIDVGNAVSQILIRMMVVMNLENIKDFMKMFRKTLQLFLFLVDAFEWQGRSEHFGVVYNRINFLMKHAHKEFILQVNRRSETPDGSLIDGFLIDLDKADDLDLNPWNLLDEIEHVIPMLESLLSFPILSIPQSLLSINARVQWLHSVLSDMETYVKEDIGEGAKELMFEYKIRHEYFNDVEAFLTRVDSARGDMWTSSLESEVKVSRGSLSIGRTRLHVRGTIIQQNRNSACIQIVGINSRMEAEWYIGKRIAYFYRAKNVKKNGSHYRCIWGNVTRPHDDNGILSAEFDSDLSPGLHKHQLRVYMYRARIEESGTIMYGD